MSLIQILNKCSSAAKVTYVSVCGYLRGKDVMFDILFISLALHNKTHLVRVGLKER